VRVSSIYNQSVCLFKPSAVGIKDTLWMNVKTRLCVHLTHKVPVYLLMKDMSVYKTRCVYESPRLL